MNEIKQQFQQWLINKGFSQKTPKGRPGTVYEYIRNIDKLCDLVCLNRTEDSWAWLAKNIYPILGFYLICKNGSVHIDGKNKGKYENFLSIFLDSLDGKYLENLQKYFIIEAFFKKEPRREYLFIKTFILDNLALDKNYELNLNLNFTKVVANNERKALQKFYDFLKEKKYDPVSQKFLIFDKEQVRIKKKLTTHYSLISVNLKRLGFWDYPGNTIYTLVIFGGYYTCPTRLYPEKDDKNMTKKKVMNLLQLSDWSLRALKKSKKLLPEPDGSYLITNVDSYIKNCFNAAERTQSDNSLDEKPIKVWWTASQIHDKYGLTTRYIVKLREEGKVPYLKLVNKKYLYYPYAFKKYAKPDKRYARIHDKKI